MNFWYHITALGGLGVTAPLCIGIALWLAAADCRRALTWLLLFGAAMLIVVASKIAFLGWGIGVMSLDFAGFSGHAARAGAVFPVAAYLLCRRFAFSWRTAAPGCGVLVALLVALLVAISRVKLHTHSASEAVSGLLLGVATAAAFIGLARAQCAVSPRPWLAAVASLVLVLGLAPRGAPVSSEQLLTGVALNLAGSDRPYSRADWKPVAHSYRPPCPSAQRHFDYICL